MGIWSSRAVFRRVDFWVRIEVGRIGVSLHLWYVRRRDLLAVESFPVDFLKPRMTEDISRSVGEITESFRDVGGEERFEEILGVGSEVGGVADFSSDDFLVQSHRIRIFRKEWRVTSLTCV